MIASFKDSTELPWLRSKKSSGICALVCALCVLGLSLGCSNSVNQSDYERVSVFGRVTIDGQPLESAAIVFQSPLRADPADQVTTFAFVENGRYRIDAESGPVVGTARVLFRAKPPAREELEAALDAASSGKRDKTRESLAVAIPDKYGDQSQLSVELSPGIENQHDFQLVSR